MRERERERERENRNDVLNTKLLSTKLKNSSFELASIAINVAALSIIYMPSHFREWPFIWEKEKAQNLMVNTSKSVMNCAINYYCQQQGNKASQSWHENTKKSTNSYLFRGGGGGDERERAK